MFIELSNKTRVNMNEIIIASKSGDQRFVHVEGADIEIPAEQYPWLLKVLGHMVEISDDRAVVISKVSAIAGQSIIMCDGSQYELSKDDMLKFCDKFESLSISCICLADKIQSLELANIDCESYQKL